MKTPLRFQFCTVPALILAIGFAGATPARGASGVEAAPQLSVSLRGDGRGTIEAGEPFHVAVRLAAPRGAARAIELAPDSGTWADALLVELLPASGDSAVAKAQPAGTPENPAATLDAKRLAGGVWRFSAAATQGLAPGEYRLRARLAVTSGRGWTGQVTTDDVPVRVVAATDAASASERIVNRAQDALLSGRLETAAGLVDEALKKTPLEARLLTVRALIAERAGNLPAAVICANAALRADAKSPVRHPDAEFDALQTRLAKARRAALDSNAAPPAVPAWSWPPIEVITAITADAAKSAFGQSMATAPRAVAPAANVAVPASQTNSPPATAPVPKPTAPPAAGAAAKPTGVAVPGASPPAAAPGAISSESSAGVVLGAEELSEEKFLADPAGQWAAGAAAGSQYSSPNYAPAKMTGPPDVPVAGDSVNAWCHGSASNATEWVELTFAKPVRATEVRVRQNNAPGTIAKVEAVAPDGTVYLWWEGADPFKAPAQATLAWFAVRVPRTDYRVAKVRLTLNLAAAPGWKEIDAVQLVGAE